MIVDTEQQLNDWRMFANKIKIKPVTSPKDVDNLLKSIDVEPTHEINITKDGLGVLSAVVTLESPEDAIRCQEAFECKLIKPRHWARKSNSNWFRMDNLSKSTDEQAILSHIQEHGQIKQRPKSINLYHHEDEDKNGYAVIECASSMAARELTLNLRSTTLNGNRIVCKLMRPRRGYDRREQFAGQTTIVALTDVHYSVTEKEIEQLCAEHGKVGKVKRQRNKQGYPSGVVQVMMNTEDEATKVFENLNGKEIKNLVVRTSLMISWANPKYQDSTRDTIIKRQVMMDSNIKKKFHSDGHEPERKLNSDGKGTNGFSGKKGRKGGVKHA